MESLKRKEERKTEERKKRRKKGRREGRKVRLRSSREVPRGLGERVVRGRTDSGLGEGEA